MNTILCVDNSGSTCTSDNYWDRVYEIYTSAKPFKLIYWNTTAKIKNEFETNSDGGTKPQSFISLLQKEITPYDLIITTDGEIADSDIEECGRRLTPELISLINSTTIHYVGTESSMNIGLNIIFGRTKKIIYYINENNYDLMSVKFDEVELGEFLSPNFAISVIVKIKNIEATYEDPVSRDAKITELRGEIRRLFSKFERDCLDKEIGNELETCFKNNEMQEFLNLILKDRANIMGVNRQKSVILNLFDRKIDFNISRIKAATKVRQQAIHATPKEDNPWSEFEDVITLDSFSLPCVLVQNTEESLITNNTILKHPFRLLSEPDIIKKVMRLIEPNPIDYATYKKLAFDRGYTVSPHTRARCKGVFVLDALDMKCVKNNCRSISVIFGNQNKVPGNLVLWNLVITYLLYKYKFKDTPYQSVILEQIVTYCRNFKTAVTFTHQCQMLTHARIEVCLWFCVQVMPRLLPDKTSNVLRSPFGHELLEFYSNTFGKDKDEYLEKLSNSTGLWTVWNYLLSNRGPRLHLEVKAQYQNYCVHKGHIILLAGRCETPYKSKCNILDADTVNSLYLVMTNKSSKSYNMDDLEIVAARANCDDEDGVAEADTHVKINLKTCWPHVICPVTKLHWKKCIGEYDVKTKSRVRMFNTYCCKYGKYPENHMDLALLFSQRKKSILTKQDLNTFEHVYSLFKQVMSTYTCDEYLSIYKHYCNESLRLAEEPNAK